MKKFLRPYQSPKDVSDTALNPSSKDIEEPETSEEREEPKEPKLRCRFHPGRPVNKVWTCCRQHVTAEPCAGLPDHVAALYPREDQIEKIHQCHATPKANFRMVCHFSD